MTVTKRKMKPRESAGDSAPTGPTLESGVKATCDACSADITHTVHVRCAERVGAENGNEGTLTCPDFDLCVDCFLHGKALGPHRPNHAYRIISSHSFPIFNRDWGADEELALIEGAQMYGLGNWADIAEHVGGRTKEECAEHYQRIYLESENYPLPTEQPVTSADVDSFPSRKAARLQELQSRPIPLPPPKPLASAPTCHEVGGYMPGRLEFEHEWENEAEVLIKDMEFGKVYHFGGDSQPAQPPPPPAEGEEPQPEEKPLPDGEKEGDEPEAELDLKLTILDMFNERYDKRMAAKELIFDRGLINYKTMSAAERKRSKEERDLITRAKVFSRIQTAQDHEEFVEGMLYEITLRKRIAELQAFRRAGITTLAESERYETARQQRLSSKAAYRDTLALSFGGSSAASSRRPTPQSQITASLRNRPPPPLTLATSSSLQLLTPLEQQLCSTLRILPRPYLFLKEVLLREWVRLKGRMGAREARRAVLREKNGELLGPEEGVGGEWGEKIERVWEFVRESAGLKVEEYSGVASEEEDAVEDGDEEMKEVEQASGAATPVAVEV